jgi:hypothetical protein
MKIMGNLVDNTGMNARHLCLTALLGAISLLSVQPSPGTTVQSLDLKQMSRQAQFIVEATVTQVQAYWASPAGITARLYNSNNAFVETDIVFNSSVSWNSYRGALRADSVDFCRVATHELGHTLGLDHPDTHGQNVVAIMNSVTSNVDSPAADDIAGIQYLYGTRTPNNNPVGNVPAKPVITNFITYSGDFNGDGKQDILWRNT